MLLLTCDSALTDVAQVGSFSSEKGSFVTYKRLSIGNRTFSCFARTFGRFKPRIRFALFFFFASKFYRESSWHVCLRLFDPECIVLVICY